MKPEIYISVDVESTGPIPGEYSMYQLGACVVDQTDKNCFYEIKLLNDNFVAPALKACGIERLEDLKRRLDGHGLYPDQAMLCFADWIKSVAGDNRPVMVGFNAPYDWSFVNWYFHKFLGQNQFGISALDIKAYYMGLMNTAWAETSKNKIEPRFLSQRPHTHNALDDAIEQAEIFTKMLDFNNHRAKIMFDVAQRLKNPR